jgi:hypothetical protein
MTFCEMTFGPAVPVPVKSMPLITIVVAALELPEMFWIVFPVATKFPALFEIAYIA